MTLQFRSSGTESLLANPFLIYRVIYSLSNPYNFQDWTIKEAIPAINMAPNTREALEPTPLVSVGTASVELVVAEVSSLEVPVASLVASELVESLVAVA